MNMLALLTTVLLPTLPSKNYSGPFISWIQYPVLLAFVAGLISIAIRDFETNI